MALNTAERRRAAFALFSQSLPGVTPNSDKDAEWRRQAFWSYSGVLVVTEVTDRDGYIVRPPAAFVMHAVDGAREAELIEADATPADRFHSVSDRSGRMPNEGYAIRVSMFAIRAGEALAPNQTSLDVAIHTATQRFREDTTTRADRDGYNMLVPTVYLMASTDDAREAALTAGSSDQDRWMTVHDPDPSLAKGTAHRISMQSYRGGEPMAPLAMELDVALLDATQRDVVDTTTRTDRDGYKMLVPTVYFQHSADSAKEVDMTSGSSDQDRVFTVHDVDPDLSLGYSHRVSMQSFRGGEVLAPVSMELDLAVVDEWSATRSEA